MIILNISNLLAELGNLLLGSLQFKFQIDVGILSKI